MGDIKFVPKEIFENILEWTVMPTFDLVIEYNNQGIILAKRRITPYQGQWALPGLRMYKGETSDEALARIAKTAVGVDINPADKIYLGQYDGFFDTDHNRQDLSTGFFIKLDTNQEINLNTELYTTFQLTYSIPPNTGAMYKFYLERYLELKKSPYGRL